MRSDCPPHYHQIKLPSGRVIRTKNDCLIQGAKDPKLLRSIGMELGHYQDEEELGILPLLAAAIPSVLGAVGGLIGGGKKKRKAAPAAAPAGVASGGVAIDAATKADVSSIVRELLSEVPPPVRDQIRSALQEYKLNSVDNKATISDIVSKVAKEFQPQLQAAAQMLKESQLQKSATNEHNVIIKDDNRWQGNTDNQEKIYKRIILMEQRVAKALEDRRKHNAQVSAAFGIPSNKVM